MTLPKKELAVASTMASFPAVFLASQFIGVQGYLGAQHLNSLELFAWVLAASILITEAIAWMIPTD